MQRGLVGGGVPPGAAIPAIAASPRRIRRRGTSRTTTLAAPTASPTLGAAMAPATAPVITPVTRASHTGARGDSAPKGMTREAPPGTAAGSRTPVRRRVGSGVPLPGVLPASAAELDSAPPTGRSQSRHRTQCRRPCRRRSRRHRPHRSGYAAPAPTRPRCRPRPRPAAPPAHRHEGEDQAGDDGHQGDERATSTRFWGCQVSTTERVPSWTAPPSDDGSQAPSVGEPVDQERGPEAAAAVHRRLPPGVDALAEDQGDRRLAGGRGDTVHRQVDGGRGLAVDVDRPVTATPTAGPAWWATAGASARRRGPSRRPAG